MIHDTAGSVRTLCLDLDTSKACRSVVDAEAKRLGHLLAEAGLRYVEDFSPSGGHHIYVPLQEPLTAPQARELVEALTFRAVSLDPSPHQNLTDGCIRVPGSTHKSGGHQALITPLAEAYDVLMRRNSPEALDRFRKSIAPEVHRLRIRKNSAQQCLDNAESTTHNSWGAVAAQHTATTAPHRGKDSVLRTVARTGLYDEGRYASDSEARMAVLTHFAACQWTLKQVTAGMNHDYPGLAALYGDKITRLLAKEWAKAHVWIAQKPPSGEGRDTYDRINHTSPTKLTGGLAEVTSASIHQLANDLENVLYAVLDHRFKTYGRVGASLRFLIRALLAYMRTNETNVVDVGCRTFAVALGKDPATIARLLPVLEQASSGILTRIGRGRGRKADSYLLQLPVEFQQVARELTWRKGKIYAVRPVFRILGDVAALTYEAIERGRQRPTTADLVRSTGFSRSAITESLAHMELLHMIRRVRGRWEIVSTTRLDALADRLGATEDRQQQISQYRKQRAVWHAWLERHIASPLNEHDIYDWEVSEYWLPPAESTDDLQHLLWHTV